MFDAAGWRFNPTGGFPCALRASVPRAVPPGTRGYRDLARDARDAQSIQIAPGVSVSVASLIDLIRIAESSIGPDARTFVPALWATLERRRRRRWAQEAAPATP